MARKKLVENETAKQVTDTRMQSLQRLDQLVGVWGKNKTQADELNKDVKRDADEIKQIMLAEKLDSSISGEYEAKLSFQHKESFDEEGLIQFLQESLWNEENGPCPYIKTVQVIDWDAVENAIYSGEINNEQLVEIDKFKTVVETPVLKLGKVKKEK